MHINPLPHHGTMGFYHLLAKWEVDQQELQTRIGRGEIPAADSPIPVAFALPSPSPADPPPSYIEDDRTEEEPLEYVDLDLRPTVSFTRPTWSGLTLMDPCPFGSEYEEDPIDWADDDCYYENMDD
jgi:hypothetical protein